MFEIVTTGSAKRFRLLAPNGVTLEDYDEIAKRVEEVPFQARKSGLVAAQIAEQQEVIETHWDGVETLKTAKSGDVIVTNLDADGKALKDSEDRLNVYVIDGNRFPELYDPTGEKSEHGEVHRARGVVTALRLTGGFEVRAPWGELQSGDDGYLILNGSEVYGAHAEPFELTYVRIDE